MRISFFFFGGSFLFLSNATLFFLFFANTTNQKNQKMPTKTEQEMIIACEWNKVEMVQHLLQKSPSLLNMRLDSEVFFFFFF